MKSLANAVSWMSLGKRKKPNPVYNSLLDGLAKMRAKGVDRAILSVYELSEAEESPCAGRFCELGEESAYYPFETLISAEQEMVSGGKNYKVVALVTQNVGELVTYPGDGVEVIERRRPNWFLPKLTRESPLNYSNSGGIHTGEDLEAYARSVAECGWTPELVAQRVDAGIEEYHTKTIELLEAAGYYDPAQRTRPWVVT